MRNQTTRSQAVIYGHKASMPIAVAALEEGLSRAARDVSSWPQADLYLQDQVVEVRYSE